MKYLAQQRILFLVKAKYMGQPQGVEHSCDLCHDKRFFQLNGQVGKKDIPYDLGILLHDLGLTKIL